MRTVCECFRSIKVQFVGLGCGGRHGSFITADAKQ